MATSAYWTAYTPDEKTPWDLRRVVHLHRRAGFAATWEELQRDLRDGPVASVDRLSSGKAAATTMQFNDTAALLADSAVAAGDISRLKAWWFYRMLFTPDPLGEKLTLLWHDHFATANGKVQDPAFMWRQNETLRRHCRGLSPNCSTQASGSPRCLCTWMHRRIEPATQTRTWHAK